MLSESERSTNGAIAPRIMATVQKVGTGKSNDTEKLQGQYMWLNMRMSVQKIICIVSTNRKGIRTDFFYPKIAVLLHEGVEIPVGHHALDRDPIHCRWRPD